MKKETSGVKETISSFLTPKGIQRTLEVEVYENGNVEIDFTLKSNDEGLSDIYKCLSINRREAVTLVFYLIRILLPNKFLTNKWKRKEEKEEKEKTPKYNN